ncbi:MAG: hypothetical protein ACRDQ1_12420, partial [Sciscionella sp.]
MSPLPPRHVPVLAVVVAHNGVPWLPALRAALAASTVQPAAIVCVDTGSCDGSTDLLAGIGAVVTAPGAGFGAAVATALATIGPVAMAGRHRAGPVPGADASGQADAAGARWLWLLHDDCAPAPEALQQLLAAARTRADIGVVGCRVRSWPTGPELREAGV